MKEQIIKILKILHLYHPLQSSYRGMLLFFQQNYYRLTYFRFKGKGYTCNFCGSTYEKFVPEYPPDTTAAAINDNEVIAGYGENVYCPNCMSKNRERLVLAVINNYLNFNNKSILHFSPESHLYSFLKNKAKVTTVDITPGFYKNIDNGIGYADATALQYPENSFDAIIANHILEHIPEDVKAMKEMYRVVKDGGLAILQVPYSTKLQTTIEEPFINDPRNQELLFGQKDHVRIYALKDYIKRLETAGFNVRVLEPEALARFSQHAIQQGETVFLCYK